MSTTKIEFVVQMTCDSCVEAVKKSLKDVQGVKSVDVDLKTGSVVVDSKLPTSDVQKRLESTGKKVAVKGYAGKVAAVSIVESVDKNVKGVVRFVQVAPNICILDGTIDGLKPGEHQITLHECGDISEGCDTVGEVYNPKYTENNRIYGDIGTVISDLRGRAEFRLEDNVINLSDVIGRSFVVTDKTQKNNNGKRLACGIIARSAGLFQNPKMICACDGLTIWDEVPKSKSTL